MPVKVFPARQAPCVVIPGPLTDVHVDTQCFAGEDGERVTVGTWTGTRVRPERIFHR